jgi:hypothetical protein
MAFNEGLGKEIPKGWEVKPLDQIANFLNGLALQKFPPEGDVFLPVIKIKELRQGITEQSDKASPNIDKKYVVNDGDVLFSWSGTLMVVIWGEGKGALNQHLFKVTSDDFEKWFYLDFVTLQLQPNKTFYNFTWCYPTFRIFRYKIPIYLNLYMPAYHNLIYGLFHIEYLCQCLFPLCGWIELPHSIIAARTWATLA